MKNRTLISFLATPALIASSPAFSAIEPAAINAGPVSIVPMVTVQTGYDDNFFSTSSNEQDETITVISPSIQVLAEKGMNAYRLAYQISEGIHQNSSTDNYTDHNLSADAHLEFSQRSMLDLKAAYAKGHEARGTSDLSKSVSAPLEYDVQTLGFTYNYGAKEATGRIELYGNHLEREYQNFRAVTAGKDDTEVTLGAIFYYKIMPKTSLLFEARNKDVDYDNDPAISLDSDSWKYLVGATWEGTAKTSGTVKVGVIEKDFDAASRKDLSTSTWEASIRWAPRTYSVVDISTGQDLAETDGTGNAIDTKTYNINWNHAWTDIISTDLGLSFMNEAYEGNSNREDDTSSVKVGLNYDMRRWLTFGVNYSYTDVESNVVGEDYTKNLVMLTVNASL